jgi:hypothetical protein
MDVDMDTDMNVDMGLYINMDMYVDVDMDTVTDMNTGICEMKIVELRHRVAPKLGLSDIGIE